MLREQQRLAALPGLFRSGPLGNQFERVARCLLAPRHLPHCRTLGRELADKARKSGRYAHVLLLEGDSPHGATEFGV